MNLPRCATLLLMGGLTACSRDPGPVEVTPPAPEPPSMSATATLRGAAHTAPRDGGARRAPLGATAWESLRWGMNEDEVVAALAKDGTRIERWNTLLKSDARTITIARGGMRGTLYFEEARGLHQVLIFGADSPSDAAGRAALARIERAYGPAAPARRRDEQHWWNAQMAVEVVVTSPNGDAAWHVWEHHVADARPERAGVSPAFDTVNGWGPFAWGASLEAVEAWLTEQKVAFERRTGSEDPGPNAPFDGDPSLPALAFRRDGMRVIAAFTQRRGLHDVQGFASKPTAAEADRFVAERVKKYGPATTVERRSTYRWGLGPTKVELDLVIAEPERRWRFVESYTPAP